MANNTFQVSVQLKDAFKQANINDTGAVCFVCTAGTPTLATLTDRFGNSIANPIALTSGLIAFQYNVAAANEESQVDLFGMTAGGYWFEYKAIGGIGPAGGPSGPNEINVNTYNKRMRMKIPFAIANGAVAATEFTSGLSLPTPAVVLNRLHGAGVLVTTAQSGKTINVGILSSGTGGAASGFINGTSLAPTAPTQFVLGTDGSLFSTNAPYVTDTETGSAANTLSLTYTLSSGTTTAAGFIILPYALD